MKKNIILSVLTLSSMMLAAQISPSADNKPWERIEENNLIINDINPEAKPAARWWWLGSAVDEKNITANQIGRAHV